MLLYNFTLVFILLGAVNAQDEISSTAEVEASITITSEVSPSETFQTEIPITATEVPSTEIIPTEISSEEVTTTENVEIPSMTEAPETTVDASSTLEESPTSTGGANETSTEEDDTFPEETQIAATVHGKPPPPVEYTAETNADLTALGIQSYANTILEGGIPVEEGEVAPPLVLPACPDTESNIVAKRSLEIRRPKRRPATCIPKRIRLEVVVHYVTNGVNSANSKPPVIPTNVRQRIVNNVSSPRSVF